MINVLITGKGSYIGTHFKELLQKYPDKYYVEELDVRDDSWKLFDFSDFDIIYHVAGIAHIKETEENKSLYYRVNRDLAVEIAKNAKKQGVRKFIFMSSMSVYGLDSSEEYINSNTKENPKTNYGISKYEAEKILCELKDESFDVVIVRPPMVYGKDSPGNLGKLFKMVRKVHVFPKFVNKRSSITVENLCYFILDVVEKDRTGVFYPQNDEYMCTYKIVKNQMDFENVKVKYVSCFNWIIKFLIGKNLLISKVFGDLCYEKK